MQSHVALLCKWNRFYRHAGCFLEQSFMRGRAAKQLETYQKRLVAPWVLHQEAQSRTMRETRFVVEKQDCGGWDWNSKWCLNPSEVSVTSRFCNMACLQVDTCPSLKDQAEGIISKDLVIGVTRRLSWVHQVRKIADLKKCLNGLLRTSFHTSCIDISEMPALVSSPSVLSPLLFPSSCLYFKASLCCQKKNHSSIFSACNWKDKFWSEIFVGSNSCYVKHI